MIMMLLGPGVPVIVIANNTIASSVSVIGSIDPERLGQFVLSRQRVDTDVIEQVLRQPGQLSPATLSLDPVTKGSEVWNQASYTWHVWISSVSEP
tara:strand:+ start:21165 stop:21449 length:285 start_codon:yes stop_codon:yes gene_type:complete